MTSPATPDERLEIVAESAALRWSTEPELVPSQTNDVWRLTEQTRGDIVLRVAWRGNPGRLITEARLGRALPRSVGYPPVLGYGWTRDVHDLTFVLTRRLAGHTLAEVWPDLTGAEREHAGRTLGQVLRTLHGWRPSAAVTDRLLSWPRSPSLTGLVGATLNPLPLDRVAALVAAAEAAGDPRTDLAREAYGWLRAHAELAPDLDRTGLPVTHGDLVMANVWWHDGRVSGLLDLEWARLAPAYLDLGRLGADTADPGAAHQLQAAILRAYPSLAVPDLDARLRYVRVALELRGLFADPFPRRDRYASMSP